MSLSEAWKLRLVLVAEMKITFGERLELLEVYMTLRSIAENLNAVERRKSAKAILHAVLKFRFDHIY